MIRFVCYIWVVACFLSCKTTKTSVKSEEKRDSLSAVIETQTRVDSVVTVVFDSIGTIEFDSIVLREIVCSEYEEKTIEKKFYGVKKVTQTSCLKTDSAKAEVTHKAEKNEVSSTIKEKSKENSSWRKGDWIMLTVVVAFIGFVWFRLWNQKR